MISDLFLKDIMEFFTNENMFDNTDRHILTHYLANSGKELRSSFFLNFFQKNRITHDIEKIAFCLEMLHNAAIIQDDIFDKADFRRNSPCLHKKLETLYPGKGKDLAVIISDILLSFVFFYVNTTAFEKNLICDIVRIFSKAIIRTSAGEYCDVRNSIKGFSTTRDLMNFYDMKTGYYTFVLPYELAACILNIPREKEIRDFLFIAGRIFQIKNDMDDIRTERFEDIRLGKITSVTFSAYTDNKKIESDKYEILLSEAEKLLSEQKAVFKEIFGSLESDYKKFFLNFFSDDLT